ARPRRAAPERRPARQGQHRGAAVRRACGGRPGLPARSVRRAETGAAVSAPRSGRPMTQNIYDDAGFFAGYSALPRSIHGLDGAPEWPTLRALLPDLNGLRVLDLGCGFGWFCRYARGAGAASVTGYDVSERMLARA